LSVGGRRIEPIDELDEDVGELRIVLVGSFADDLECLAVAICGRLLLPLGLVHHRVAISNSRLLSADESGVTFKYKDYRVEGPERYTTMTLEPGEFIRRFLIHVLPKGFHRIRHYGLLAKASCGDNIARARELLAVVTPQADDAADNQTEPLTLAHPCPCCGGPMSIIESFGRGSTPRHRPTAPMISMRIDTS